MIHRRIFFVLSALSLVLCMATFALWFLTAHAYVGLKWDRYIQDGTASKRVIAEQHWYLGSMYGSASLTLLTGGHYGDLSVGDGVTADYSAEKPVSPWRVLRGEWGWGGDASVQSRYLSVPIWSLVLLSLVLPVWFVPRLMRKPKGDTCRVCGYNLTGNVSGVCPECGMVIERKPQVTA